MCHPLILWKYFEHSMRGMRGRLSRYEELIVIFNKPVQRLVFKNHSNRVKGGKKIQQFRIKHKWSIKRAFYRTKQDTLFVIYLLFWTNGSGINYPEKYVIVTIFMNHLPLPGGSLKSAAINSGFRVNICIRT